MTPKEKAIEYLGCYQHITYEIEKALDIALEEQAKDIDYLLVLAKEGIKHIKVSEQSMVCYENLLKKYLNKGGEGEDEMQKV